MGAEQPVVELTQGRVRGLGTETITAFRGIPFAASPIGELRFRPPEPPARWSEVRAGAVAGPAAPQGPSRLESVMGHREPDWNEDGCLTVNVWTPTAALTDGRPRPVLLWFHGGGFSSGSGGWDFYDGARLAEAGDLVVVTANYRLNALGYLWLPEIGADNLGTRDQIAALRWVHEQVAAFGGDPTLITVGGQSAGAYTAMSLAVDPATAPLVHRVIAESGPWGMLPQPQAAAEQSAARYLELLGIERGAELGRALRAVPAGELVSTYLRLGKEMARPGRAEPPMYPVLGGAGMPAGWPDGLDQLAGKQVLLGRTEHEMTAFLPPSDSLDRPELAPATEELFGAGVTRIAEFCAANGAPAHVYRFDRVTDAVPGLGATHCAELPFVFDNLDTYADAAMLGSVTEADHALAHTVCARFARFAVDGLTGDADWPGFDSDRFVHRIG